MAELRELQWMYLVKKLYGVTREQYADMFDAYLQQHT